VRAVSGQAKGWQRKLTAILRAAVRLPDVLLGLLPLRFRRAADKLEHQRGMRVGHLAAGGFLVAAVVYGLIGGGHLVRFAEAVLIGSGFQIAQIEITGHGETPELAVLEQLDLDTDHSLVTLSVRKAQARISELPWVGHASVRKSYPDTLHVIIEERVPYALWQNNNYIYIVDQSGGPIVTFDDPRFGNLPLVVGAGANVAAGEFLTQVQAHDRLARGMQAGVFVAERRWNLMMENGVTVQLPEVGVAEALEQLAVLDAVDGLLSRDVTQVDLRLADRITVRLPDDTAETRKVRNAAELKQLKKKGART